MLYVLIHSHLTRSITALFNTDLNIVCTGDEFNQATSWQIHESLLQTHRSFGIRYSNVAEGLRGSAPSPYCFFLCVIHIQYLVHLCDVRLPYRYCSKNVSGYRHHPRSVVSYSAEVVQPAIPIR